jgi:hypothetical protein
VIRDDGVDSFHLEVNTNGPVSRVRLDLLSPGRFTTPGASPIVLHDDGVDGDRVASDSIFTTGPFRLDPSYAVPLPTHLWGAPESPEGLAFLDLGIVVIEEQDLTQTEFLLPPAVGILRSDIPATAITSLSPDVAISPHLVNIRSETGSTQQYLRFLGGDLAALTGAIYAHLPDTIHHLLFFSTYKIEHVPRVTAANFNAGVHGQVRVDYSGTGFSLFDSSSYYGSDGVLLSLNVLDAYDRGIYSGNATHEITHSWSAFVDPVLGLKDDSAHWHHRGNAGSLVGGLVWQANGDGSFTIDCAEGRSGATHAPPIDRYMAGLIDAHEVPDLMVYTDGSPSPFLKCQNEDGRLEASEIVTVRSLADVQAVHGPRIPGPAGSQKEFVLGFVAESIGRLLNPTEMTFYEILADHYTRPVEPGQSDPYHGFNWVSISRFWGGGTTWRSRLFTDSDRDGAPTEEDCDDGNSVAWATPGEARNVMPHADRITLEWEAPAVPGATVVTYDTLRSGSAGDFVAGATCVEAGDGSDTTASDGLAPPPDQVFFYLVRARNPCPGDLGSGPLGADSSGVPRLGRSCPVANELHP